MIPPEFLNNKLGSVKVVGTFINVILNLINLIRQNLCGGGSPNRSRITNHMGQRKFCPSSLWPGTHELLSILGEKWRCLGWHNHVWLRNLFYTVTYLEGEISEVTLRMEVRIHLTHEYFAWVSINVLCYIAVRFQLVDWLVTQCHPQE